MGAFRITGRSLIAAASQPRAWALGWLLVTVTAAALVLPLLLALQQALDHHPGASLSLSQSLDLDFARRHPELLLRGGGAVLLVLLAWTALGSGLMAGTGLVPRLTFSEFLAACGRGLWPGVRVLGIGLLLALLLGWGLALFDAWLQVRLADADPGASIARLPQWRCFTLGFGLEALRWGRGLVFLLLLFAAKVARAQMLGPGRRSALLAWVRAFGCLVRHPLRALLVTGMLAGCWLACGAVLGGAVAWAEAGGRLELMLAASQLHVAALQILLAANFLAAREFAGIGPFASLEPGLRTAPAKFVDGDPPRLLTAE